MSDAEAGDAKMECGFCIKFMEFVRTSESFDIIKFTRLEMMDSSTCDEHAKVIETYPHHDNIMDLPNFIGLKLSNTVEYLSLWLDIAPGVDTSIGNGSEAYERFLEMQRMRTRFVTLRLLPSAEPECQGKPTARYRNNKWIDVKLLLQWKRLCDSRNYKTCHVVNDLTQENNFHPTWLVDTQRMCLVPGATGISYVALSYVWGEVPFFKTTRENISQLQQDFALANPKELGIPRTISDALSIVSLLDERYLWVDALCIVQDHNHTKHTEINKMSMIYSGATVTIFAEDGEDANYGLQGLQGISQPRDRSQPDAIFTPKEGYHFVVVNGDNDSGPVATSESKWRRRAWTFQEDLFSKRCLIFKSKSVEWRCGCCCLVEDVDENLVKNHVITSRELRTDFLQAFPRLTNYGRIVNAYNMRELTHPQDAIYAFAGITTEPSRKFIGAFICGLPLLFFDVALCWQPKDGKCERRIPSAKDKKPRESTKSGLPSWSWIGWRCSLDESPWRTGTNQYAKNWYPPATILSSILWHSLKWGAEERRPIYQSQRRIQELRTYAVSATGDDVSSGWERFDYSLKSRKDPYEPVIEQDHGSSPPRYFYKHKYDPSLDFWRPFPTCDDEQLGISLSTPEPNNDTLICGRTTRKHFSLSHDPTNLEQASHRTASIQDSEGHWIGAIHLQGSSNIFDIDQELSPFLKEEYYNVLWVERKDGIAYRKALGHVIKSAWEAQPLEEIDLILG
ncbi:hypothetical protein HYALB_00009056 [Hymenoscyphus albidus]|uniref:Heterokaryon incompatibility domain-containing protein n=1 Tax=Hymenoscyphus albidus TaxID=595503 RepID=A0A9N9Q5L3_9HELO|nr:hypothetical protein HYALB_00009056 [Hymenoscyphus albidus]